MSRNKNIRLATLFSGIGAIEQALIKMKLPHKVVFACDNGEIELIPLSVQEQKEYLKLRKSEKTLNEDEKARYEELKAAIESKNQEIKETVLTLADKEAKRRYVEGIYCE